MVNGVNEETDLPGMKRKIGSGIKTIVVASLQIALVFVVMQLAFTPFSYAPTILGYTSGYLTYLLYPVLLYWILRLAHKGFNRLSINGLGFSWRNLPLRIVSGFAVGTVAALAVVILTALWQPEVTLELSRPGVAPKDLLSLLADVWETSFAEEFLFRGYFLVALLRRKMGAHTAVVWNILLFTLVHFMVKPLWWLLPIAATGFLLSYLYYASASIWAPVGCHFAINLVFGLINRSIALQLNGIEGKLAIVAVAECVVYLAVAALLMAYHHKKVKAGKSDFPHPALTPDYEKML